MGVDEAKRNEWKNTMVAAMRTAMGNTFGANSTIAILYHLRNRGITIEEGVEKPKEFIDALSSIFGEGTKTLERMFVDVVGEASGVNTKGMNLGQAMSKSCSTL